MDGFHHLRRRVRVSRGLEPFPARTIYKRMLDRLMYVVAFTAPIALLPQIHRLYTTKSGVGLSMSTWIMLAVINLLWVFYALAHRDRQLVIATGLLFVCDIVIVFGLLLY